MRFFDSSSLRPSRIHPFALALLAALAAWLSPSPNTAHAQCPPNFGGVTNFGVGSFPYSVAVGDFNGDGRPDLAVANQSGNNVSILLGTGSGSFGPATNFAVGTNPKSEIGRAHV